MIRTPSPRRRARLRAGAAAVALAATLGAGALTGCESKSGVAAFVGSTPVETSELTSHVDNGMQTLAGIGQQVERSQVQSAWLDNLIQRDLARQVAREQGVGVSPGDVNVFLSRFAALVPGGIDGLRTSLANSGVSASDLPVVFETLALQNAIAGKLAPQLVAPDAPARQAFNQQHPYPGMTYEQVAPLFRELLVFNERRGVARDAMQAEAHRIGVRVNPRFGSWDAAASSVGPTPNDLSQVVAPSGAPAPIEGGEQPAPASTP